MNYGNSEVFLTARQREALIRSYLGKTVEVVVDRPVGFVHFTKGITLRYTINYGYLPGVTGGDGEEQDVYILGVEEPLERFTGRIIGAVRRADDNEDKLVAAPEGMQLHQGQIAEAIEFVEKYFDSRIEPVYHKSCGVIPFRRREGSVELLLVHQIFSGFWSFPKGHMNAREQETETALRELREETGLSAHLMPDFRTAVEYPVSAVARKEVVLFLGQAAGRPELPQEEIRDFRWVSIPEAKRLLGAVYAPVVDRISDYFEQGGYRENAKDFSPEL